jgi:hypothetical protein
MKLMNIIPNVCSVDIGRLNKSDGKEKRRGVATEEQPCLSSHPERSTAWPIKVRTPDRTPLRAPQRLDRAGNEPNFFGRRSSTERNYPACRAITTTNMHSLIRPNAWVALKLPSGSMKVLQITPNT